MWCRRAASDHIQSCEDEVLDAECHALHFVQHLEGVAPVCVCVFVLVVRVCFKCDGLCVCLRLARKKGDT